MENLVASRSIESQGRRPSLETIRLRNVDDIMYFYLYFHLYFYLKLSGIKLGTKSAEKNKLFVTK